MPILSPAVAYALAFALAGGVCAVGTVHARLIEDADTRRGLVALLATSGSWAITHAVLLLVPSTELKTAVYLVGLILGFSTVFAWLYFCSAYTGRQYHRRPAYRRAAVALYLLVVAVKVTNPIHHLYFTTAMVSTPFPHLAIRQGLFHWVVTGLSYTLAAVGMFALFEMFANSEYDATPLAVLVGLAGLPVVFDVVGYATPLLLDMIHAPLGVAAFTLGVLFVFENRFLAIQLTEGVEGPTIFLDDSGRIREYNHAARRLFPGLDDAVGDPADTVPELAAVLADDEETVTVTVDGERRHYVVSENAFEIGQGTLGRIVVFLDVTQLEHQRRELERHNQQLENLSDGMRHELRNAVTIIRGNVRWAIEQLEAGNVNDARSALRKATDTTDRTTRLMNDFATLAQYGRTVTDSTPVEFREVVDAAWPDDADATLTVDGSGSVEADPARFELLFTRAFEFVLDSGASTVVVERRDDGVTITGDGEPPAGDPERYFDYGDAVSNATSGTALPMVRTLAQVHGWDAALDSDDEDGIRLVVTWAASRRRDS
ncbi:histidine kinase N-terminal 7TM domain-containing protein [Haloplanus aerogenes]|uniref:Histidine kinase n=1 Tax=Haloplanus aerogenes TaxID=660522 RepID=A0A3M0DSH3_9EURY|nr:histidine kinase N-terminal 7TM domain-containing protein [Haloplanus aerogenes]AZH24634.1 histidine kinase [Haloplanus aerogenes]RMB23710.1 signal transduction histidine kinase [Haloplanus aerogenes]